MSRPAGTGGPPGPGSRHKHEFERALSSAAAAARLRRQLHHEARAARRSSAEPTRGERAADAVARAIGSWRFLAVQTTLLAGWVVLNVVAWSLHWDPYPFILLNLMLSFQAAYSAPVLLMSANRQADVDREQARRDFLVNRRSEAEVEELLNLVRAQLAQGAELLDRTPRPPAGDR